MTKGQHNYAGFSKRLLAHNIDLVPILTLLYLFSYLVPRSSYDPIYIFAIYLTYQVISEIIWEGTIGKQWVKIRVVNYEGKPIKTHQSVVRNISKLFSLILLFGGFVMISFNKRKQGLHDLIGGTVVLLLEE